MATRYHGRWVLTAQSSCDLTAANKRKAMLSLYSQFMGKPLAYHCGWPSAEQIVQTVHSRSSILRSAHCLCPCISFGLVKTAQRAAEQTVPRRRLPSSCILKRAGIWSRDSRLSKRQHRLCQDAELITLSWEGWSL